MELRILCILVAALLCELCTAGPAGREFALSFMQNYKPGNNDGPSRFMVEVSSPPNALLSTKVKVTALDKVFEKTLKPGTGESFQLPDGVEMVGSTRSQQTVRVEADQDVLVLSLNFKPFTADTSVIYPIKDWGTEYYIYTPLVGTTGTFKEFAITNQGNKNNVEIKLSGAVTFQGQQYSQGSTLTINMEPFESVQIQSTDDLTGSKISAKLPVAVFSGHSCTWYFSDCNHVYEQLLPISSWGTEFFVATLAYTQPPFRYDTLIIQASQNTKLQISTQDGASSPKQMMPGETLYINIPYPNSLHFTADKGIQVLYKFNGGTDVNGVMNDPFLMTILSTDRLSTSYTIDSQAGFTNEAIIIARTSDLGKLTIDSTSISKGLQWIQVGKSEYSWTQFSYGEGPGFHQVVHPDSPFALYSFGASPENGYGSPAPGNPQASVGTCWAMGDPHYRTFDGTYYNFLGNCTYIMAKNCNPDTVHPAFEILTENVRHGSAKVTSVDRVVIRVRSQNISIKRNEFGIVRISESQWFLPISLDNGRVTLRQSGLSVILETDFGLSVQYDWQEYLVINVPGNFMGRTCGMCGNFNGKKDDDYTTPSGTLASSISALGKSWRVPRLQNDPYCMDDCVDQCESCQGQSWVKRLEAKAFCNVVTLLTDGPFRDCNTLIDSKVFYENCLFDYCMGNGRKNFLCQTAQTYKDACQRAGVHVFNWRSIIGCPAPKCPENSKFESCACPATCENPTPSADCKANCVEACVCMEGYLWSGNKCVPKTQCGCVFVNGADKRYLQAGETIWADDSCTKKCTCNPTNGQVNCENTGCPSGSGCSVVKGIRDCYVVSQATCSIYGDPHYYTFDKGTYDFQGTCTYTAAEGCHLEGTQLIPFAVIVENEKLNGIQLTPNVSVAKVVIVEVYDLLMVMRRDDLHQIMVNGILTNIPSSLNGGKVIVQQEGYQNVILTDFGLRVAYDMVYHVSITVPSSYHSKTCGLCGNFNGNMNDDLLLPDGKEAKDLKSFGAAWKVAVPGVVCDDGCSGDVCPMCPADKKAVFEKDCKIITNPQGPFAACHLVINPASYLRDCVFDVCMSDGDPNMLSLKCPGNSHYEICAQSCDAPCPGLTKIIDCKIKTCAEGCLCDSGFLTNGTGCVKADQCSCYYKGQTYEIGQTVISKDCTERLTCLPSGEVNHEAISCGTNEVCKVKNGAFGCYPNPNGSGTCWVMGDPHYRTFDGEYYDFMGNCTYIMAKNCHEDGDHPAFEVQARNERFGSSKGTYVSEVIIKVYDQVITMVQHETGLVRISDTLWYLPIYLANGKVTLKQSGLSVVLETDFGLSVQYNWEHYLMIKIPDSFMGKTCGMCGNFNGKKNDDRTTPSGSLASNIRALGNSWRVPGLKGDAYCTDDCVDKCEKCEGEPWYDRLEAETFCHLVTVLTDGPLRECKTLIDPLNFYKNCLNDYCMGKGLKNFLCKTVQIYTDACQRAHIKVHDWRHLIGCPAPTCPANSHFESCACAATCENPTPSADCKTNCLEACVCNEGYLWSGNKCVPKSQCGCLYTISNEKHYLQAGESIWGDDTCSKKCTCNPTDGQVYCETTSCPTGTACSIAKGIRGCHAVSYATCNIYGDPHYNTFDGNTYDFQGTCTYTAAKSCHLEGTQLNPFAVIVENEKWTEIQSTPNVSMAKVVIVEVYGMILVLRRSQLHQIMVNGILTNIPISLEDGSVMVQQQGFLNVITTDFGLRVTYDMAYHVTITVPSSYLGKTCGMCGTYNGKKNNELLLPDGTPTNDINTFGAAWKVAVPGVVCNDGCIGGFCPKCPADKEAVFKKDCSIITDAQGPFAACHSIIKPDSYFRDCVFDVCAGNGNSSFLCHSIAAYMIDCQDFGVAIKNWRTPTFCPFNCPLNSHYETCARSCHTPCPGLTEIVNCDVQTCAEGCVCDSGFYNNGSGCVKADQCSCYMNGLTYKIGESVITADCHSRLTCFANGIVNQESMHCKSDEVCRVSNGVLGCYQKECVLGSGGSFTLFNGTTWTLTSMGAFDLVKVCDNAGASNWFRVVVELQVCGSEALKPVALYVFVEDVLITINSKQEIWFNGRKVTLPTMKRSQILVKIIDQTVVIEKKSAFKLSYSQTDEITITVSEDIASKLCGVCGTGSGSITGENMEMRGNLLCFAALLLCGLTFAGPAGRQFAISFMQNYMERKHEAMHFQVEVLNPSTKLRAIVKITALGKIYEKTVQPGHKESFQLPDEVEMVGSTKTQQTVQVESDQDILVSSVNYKLSSTGVSVIYPVKQWGTEYYVFTPKTPSSRKQIPNAYKEFSITNYKDKNSVEVHLTAGVKFQGQEYPKGSKLIIDLEPFESVQIQTEEDNEQKQYNPNIGDLSGSRVNAKQPVAVFTGHSCTWFFTGCDHVYEQLLPVNSWGKEFIVTPIAYQKPEGKFDTVYIQASQDTLVKVSDQNGKTTQKGMKAGETYSTHMKWPTSLYITADKGIQVLYEFNGGINEEGILNDPFLINILPTDQFSTSYVLVTQAGFTNEAIVVVRTKDLGGLKLGNTQMSKDIQWHKTDRGEYSWTQITYGDDSNFHHVAHPDSPFALYSFGVSRVNGYGSSAFGNIQEPAEDCNSVICSEGERCQIVGNKAACFKIDPFDPDFFPPPTLFPENPPLEFTPFIIYTDTDAPIPEKSTTTTVATFPPITPPSGPVGTCWVMGDPHYRTFDGTYYNFMGNCTYIMAKNCLSDNKDPEFEVQAKNEHLGSSKVTSVSMVKITVYKTTVIIVRHQTGLVIINNSLWNLPVSLAGNRVKLWQSGLSVILETDFGLSVQYDWEQYLVIKIPDTFKGKMCGMCGNFNGKKDDDHITATDSGANNIGAELGKRWRVPGLKEDAYCTDGCTGQCDGCKNEPWYDLIQAKAFCAFVSILAHGPLRDCNTLIDTDVFYNNCLLDYCMGKGYKNFLCRTAQTYTDACQRDNIKVYDWRGLLRCPKPQCTENSHFESSASPCPATCENPTAPDACKAKYGIQACVCDKDYFRSGNKCVPKSQCGCVYAADGRSRYLQPNETFWADDNCQKQCTCNPQTKNVDCKATSCPFGNECKVVKNIRNCYPVSHATCNIYGDPHYNTFDKHTYDFQGTCTYTAAQGCKLKGTQLTPFAVIVENEKWNGVQLSPNVSVANVVIVEVYGLTLLMRRNENHQITINGVLTNIPVSLHNGKVVVQQVGFQNEIITDFGLRVTYDMVYHIGITVPSSYHGKTCGLCGNYNGNKNDEYILPDGKETKDLKTFGAAWKVAVPGVVCDNGCTGDICPKCPSDKKAVFEKDCSIITDPKGQFTACHNVLNPESYFRDCVFDVCMSDGDPNMLCNSIAAYMIDSVKCPANSHYEICAQSCSAPCPGLTEIIKCDVDICAEGCMCNSGFFNNGTGCVKADQCSCYESGHTYKIGESVIKDGCHERLTCLPSGEVKHEIMSCKSDEICTKKNDVRGCFRKQCVLEAGGVFTLFSGESWIFTSLGAFELVKPCDESLAIGWFRVVAQVQSCGETGRNQIVALHAFFEDLFVTVSAKQEIWVNGRKAKSMERNGVSVKAKERIVIIRKGSEIMVSYMNPTDQCL
ncbi:IgGFc-binding protein-like [Hoplias malabaricus]|uniref:IgGFc-binding protein-like n=1 Tax=Hoplias malabaricus TaxID=27720 RepID=UPI003461EBD7